MILDQFGQPTRRVNRFETPRWVMAEAINQFKRASSLATEARVSDLRRNVLGDDDERAGVTVVVRPPRRYQP